MPGLLKAIFKQHDGSRQKVRDEVVSSRESVERAVNRFEETIRDLMERNDRLTGRANAHQSSK